MAGGFGISTCRYTAAGLLAVTLTLTCAAQAAAGDSGELSALNIGDAASAVSLFPLRADPHSDPIAIDDLNGDGVSEVAEVDYRYIEDAGGASHKGGPTTVRLTIMYSPFLSGAAPQRAGFTAYVAQTARGGVFGDVFLVRDVSGDRIPDVVVTETSWPRAGSDRESGTAWVIFGHTDGSTVNTGQAAGWGYTIAGAGRGAGLGGSVYGGRDVNGDGVGDLVIDTAGDDEGRQPSVYVVFGKPTATDVDVSAPGAWGYRIARAGALGTSADVNGDDRAEVVVSRRTHDGYAILVLPGKDTPDDEDPATALLTLIGGTGFLTDSGDLNGDGRADLVLVNPYYGSSPTATFSRTAPAARAALLIPPPNPGAVFVVFGAASPHKVDLDNMTSDEGYMIRGADAPDRLDAASLAGDFNGDALPDLVINAPGARRYCGGGGGAYVVFSGPVGKSLRLADPRERALRLDAGRSETRLAELPAGDIDQDGHDDLLIYTQPARISAGESVRRSGRLYTVLGRNEIPALSDTTPPRAMIVLHGATFQSLLEKGFIRVDLTLSEPARVKLVLALVTPKHKYPRFLTRELSLDAGRTTDIRFALDRRARRKIRAGAAEIRAAWRKLAEQYDRERSAKADVASAYGPIWQPHGLLTARARLEDKAGNRCRAYSGISGSTYVL